MAVNSAINAVNSVINAIRPVSPDEVYANSGLIMDVGKRLRWDYDSRKDLVQEVAKKLNVQERFVNVAVHRSMERLTNIVRKMERDDAWRDAG